MAHMGGFRISPQRFASAAGPSAMLGESKGLFDDVIDGGEPRTKVRTGWFHSQLRSDLKHRSRSFLP